MSLKTRLSLLAVVSLALAAGGCVPSDAELASEMSATRRQAYLEWKASRDRGDRPEALAEGPLSLDDAVKLALQYNKNLRVAIEERDVTRGDRIAAYDVILPSFSASSSAVRYENGRGRTDIESYNIGLTVTQPIMQGEAIPATLRRARLYTALTDELIREQVQTLITNVAGNYYDVLLGQHMVEVHREALTSAEAQYRMVSEKKKQETATEYDVLRAQVDVATYRARMISAQNSIDTNRVSLLKNMGVSQDSEITFSDKLEFLPMRPVFERAVELASGLRPDLRQAELNARIAEEAVRISRSAFFPSLAASFTQGWRDDWNLPIRDSFGRNPWQAGLRLDYSFGADTVGKLHADKAKARQRHIDVLDKQETTLKEIRQYMNSLANAEEMVKALEVNQDASREALRLVLVGYQAGVKTEVDVTDARKALTEVQGQYYEALTDHTKARLNLQVAMGVLGPCEITDWGASAPRVPIANIEEFAATDYVPPAPIPMPSADDLRPVSRAPMPVPATPVDAFGEVGPSSVGMMSPPAPEPVMAPVAPAAPVPAPVGPSDLVPVEGGKYEPIRSEPALSGASLPLPPMGETTTLAVMPPSYAGDQGTPGGMLPVVETARASRDDQPLFTIKVRDGAGDLPDVAARAAQ